MTNLRNNDLPQDTDKLSKDQIIDRLFSTVDMMNGYLERDHQLRKGFLKEKRIKTIMYSLFLGLPLIFYLLMYLDIVRAQAVNGDYVALVKIKGAITADGYSSADNLVPAIKRACDDEKAKGIVLQINSPGGTPVQSDQIYNAIMKCRTHQHRKVVAVGEDAVASGAYWIASAADEIYVNASTITGSIGVKMEGFGLDLTRFASNYGVERRVLTAGENKVRADMYAPLKTEDVEKNKAILTQLHQHFIAAVETNRKDKLSDNTTELFSGDFWVGSKAQELGLVDGIADYSEVIDQVFKVENAVDYSPRRTFFDHIRQAANPASILHELKQWIVTSQSAGYWAM